MMGIVGWGHAVPPVVETSDDVERRIVLPTGWIERRLGIRSRRLAASHQATSDLAVEALQNALQTRSEFARNHGLLLLATSSPDHPLPPTAPLVAHRAGLRGWGAIDVAGACCGFLQALAMASTQSMPVAIIAANVLSRRVNPLDSATAGLFADGAGAILLEPNSNKQSILGFHLGSDGSRYDAIRIPMGGSRQPFGLKGIAEKEQFMKMERGPEVFRAAVNAMVESGKKAMDQAGLAVSDIDWWIPHQANARLIAEAGSRLGFGPLQTVSIVAEWGNSSAASISTALSIAAADGRLQRGQKLLLTAAGAGMTEAAAVIEW